MKSKDLLLVVAVVCEIVAISMLAHRNLPRFWILRSFVIAMSIFCVSVARDRETTDTFLSITAAVLTMFAVVLFTDFNLPHWWVKFLSLMTGVGACLVLTRRKQQTIGIVLCIVAFRLCWALSVNAVRHFSK